MEKKSRGSTPDRNIKQSLYRALKGSKGFRWNKFLDYSLEEVKEQLEENFTKEMNWENYGSYWGVTFYIPRRLYRYTSLRSPECRKCWSLKNLKPDILINCYRQKATINIDDVEKYNLYDILPVGKLDIKHLTKNDNNCNLFTEADINEIQDEKR